MVFAYYRLGEMNGWDACNRGLMIGVCGRRRRGSVLLFTLMVVVVLLVLGCAYLQLIERDQRFAGIQARSERAWCLAQSGLEYFALCGCALDSLNRDAEAINPPKLLVRVYMPDNDKQHYFELFDMGQGRLMSRGVVVGTLSSTGRDHNLVERRIVTKAASLEDAYDDSCSL